VTLHDGSTDYTAHFRREAQAFLAAARRAAATGQAAPAGAPVPASLPDWIAAGASALEAQFRAAAPGDPVWTWSAAGQGERFRFVSTDGAGTWAVGFNGEHVTLADPAGPCDLTLAGTASDLMLFLWQRAAPEVLDLRGDTSLVVRYFALVPPF